MGTWSGKWKERKDSGLLFCNAILSPPYPALQPVARPQASAPLASPSSPSPLPTPPSHSGHARSAAGRGHAQVRGGRGLSLRLGRGGGRRRRPSRMVQVQGRLPRRVRAAGGASRPELLPPPPTGMPLWFLLLPRTRHTFCGGWWRVTASHCNGLAHSWATTAPGGAGALPRVPWTLGPLAWQGVGTQGWLPQTANRRHP